MGVLTLQDSPDETSAIFNVAIGSLLSVQSFCICTGGACADRQIDRMLGALKEHNESLRESIHTMERSNEQYREQNERAQEIVQRSERNVEELEQHTSDLERASKELQEQVERSDEALERSRKLSEQMELELETLRELKEAGDHEIEELHSLVVEQKQQIEHLAQQARNLNALQRESVKMIQNLALYGNKCKEFGVSLKEVSSELRQTDESLGLTAGEMQAQVRALNSIVHALERTDRSLRAVSGGTGTKKKKRVPKLSTNV